MDFADDISCSLRLAADLANSAGDDDPTTDPGRLAAWLRARAMSGPLTPTAEDGRALAGLRERLRAVFHADESATAATILNELLAHAGALPYLSDHDGEPWHLHYTPLDAPVAARVAAEAAMALALLVDREGIERLRVCAGEDCEDVFVDASRNRSRRFCDPATCGNRAHVAAYRARQRSRGADAGGGR